MSDKGMSDKAMSDKEYRGLATTVRERLTVPSETHSKFADRGVNARISRK
jgi:hypothetical protein